MAAERWRRDGSKKMMSSTATAAGDRVRELVRWCGSALITELGSASVSAG